MEQLGTQLKEVATSFSAKEQDEGRGARVRRYIGTRALETLDPFLMLDMASFKLPGGFPAHPHRGFETISYLLEGSISHEDSKGHEGIMGPGDV